MTHSPHPTQQPIPMLDLRGEVEELWDELNAAIQRVLRSGRFIGGPEVQAFEAEAADYLGAAHAIGLNSGTDALVIGLRALGIGRGDEVITTPFSFFATAEAILHAGAKPVFVDIDSATLNIDPELIEDAVTPRTRAILPVHLFGLPAPMDSILRIAQDHGLLVLEDCAQAFGATYRTDEGEGPVAGRRAGTMGDAGAISMYPTKNLGAVGDAGMLVTDDGRIAQLARSLGDHGARSGEGRYTHHELGYNSRLDALQAALLRVKLGHVGTWNQQREIAAMRYTTALAGLPGVVPPAQQPGRVYHQYTIRIQDGLRDAVQTLLAEDGISSVVYYPVALHQQPVFDPERSRFPVAERLTQEVLSLPLWPGMDAAAQDRVVSVIRRVVPH